jgi:hypothetical protein
MSDKHKPAVTFKRRGPLTDAEIDRLRELLLAGLERADASDVQEDLAKPDEKVTE